MRKLIGTGLLVGMLAGFGGISSLKADARGTSKDVTLRGEVVDTYCYATMGARGESHRSCGLACAAKGIPLGLLEEKTGNLYVLLPNKDETSLPPEVADKMGRTVSVTGREYKIGNSEFLTVESVK